MKVTIDPAKCIGCEKCTTLAPEVFEYSDDDEISHVKTPVVSDPALIEKVKKAASACPTSAIQLAQ